MLAAILRTIKRLMVKIHLPGFDTVRLLLEGFAVEFNRVVTLKNRVLSAVVPNVEMDTDAVEDYETMYGIPQGLGGTDAEKIGRIMERAAWVGFGGAEFLEDQVRRAGFDLYAIPNPVSTPEAVQFGTTQAATFRHFGLSTQYTAPQTVPGQLIVGASPGPDTDAAMISGRIYPPPLDFSITDDATLWGFFTFLSPTEGAVVGSGSLLSLTQAQFDYLEKVVITSKHMQHRIIAQVSIS